MKTVLLGCEHSAGMAREALLQSGQPWPEAVEWVSLTCGGSLDPLHLLRALEAGADKVLVLTCNDGACRSVDGTRRAQKRVQAVQALLAEAGLPTGNIVYRSIAPSMAADLAQWLQDL